MSIRQYLDPNMPKWLRKQVKKAIRRRYARGEVDWSDYTDRMLHATYLNDALGEHARPKNKRSLSEMRTNLEACKRVRERAIAKGTWHTPH